jgi:hypothetical protein
MLLPRGAGGVEVSGFAAVSVEFCFSILYMASVRGDYTQESLCVCYRLMDDCISSFHCLD